MSSPANMEAAKETKDSKKQESKKSSLLSRVTGKKDVAKGSEGEPLPTVSEKEKERKGVLVEAQLREEDLVRRPEKDALPVASQWGGSPNPFEDLQISDLEASLESKSELKPPVPAARAPQTKAVKPRPHPTATKIANSSLGTATIFNENLINEALMKKYQPSDPTFAYAQLTHDELMRHE